MPRVRLTPSVYDALVYQASREHVTVAVLASQLLAEALEARRKANADAEHLERLMWIAAIGVEEVLAFNRALLLEPASDDQRAEVEKWLGLRRAEAARMIRERLRGPLGEHVAEHPLEEHTLPETPLVEDTGN